MAERMKMKINTKDFRVREGDEVGLRKWSTSAEPVYKSKKHYQELPGWHVAQLSSLHQLLHPSNRHALLLILQAMDAWRSWCYQACRAMNIVHEITKEHGATIRIPSSMLIA